jgi:hypothetical protein
MPAIMRIASKFKDYKAEDGARRASDAPKPPSTSRSLQRAPHGNRNNSARGLDAGCITNTERQARERLASLSRRSGVCAGGLPDRPAIDAIIDDPFVQPGEHLIDRTAGCELDDKESEKKYGEEPHGD